jgi:hypothetical protein
MKICTALCGVVLAAIASGSAAFGQGDNPNNPIPLSGDQSYMYDSSLWTTTQGSFAPNCFGPAVPVFQNDVFICWTATVNGTVTVSTCGGSPAGTPDGTRIAMWNGCNALFDTEPNCCSDTACGTKDAEFTCDVECGHTYLIRVGLDPGTPNLVKKVRIEENGKPCDGTSDPECATCCTRAPMVTNYTAPVSVTTSWEDVDSEFVVHVFDMSTWSSQAAGPWPTVPRYEHPDWTKGKLGSVFGVTLDNNGNIYVAHTGIYQGDSVGTVGGGGPGVIYKLDTASGLPTKFATLPNVNPCAPATQCAPGLGNLTFSCDHNSIYCTNFDDGRIYRISMTGALQEAYDFGDQAIESPLADSADVAGTVAPLGRRTWGVAVSGDRLYFSVYREDQAFPSATDANEIWSIPLTPVTGAFAGAVPTLEITVPVYPNGIWSNPVADIAFDGECCMYLAERSMQGHSNPGYHVSRLLKYCVDPATNRYTPSGDTFETGVAPNLVNSCAGGVGLDLAPGGLVWTSSDAMNFGPTYYGIIGLPQSGGVNAQGILIDNNSDVVAVDKSFQGSVEVACRVADVCTASVTAECHLGPDGLPDGQYELSITVHNGMEGAAATLLLLPDLGTFVHLIPQLEPGESRKITILTDLLTPGTVTMDIGLFNGLCNGCHCCGVLGVEFEVPECYCMILEDLVVDCYDDRDPTTYWYDVSFILHNISPWAARHLFIVPQDMTVTTVPEYVQLPFLLPGQTFPIAFTIHFPGPPPNVDADGFWHTEISLSMFAQNLNLCCKVFVDVSGPVVCASNVRGDLNGDENVDGADLGIMLSDWGVVPLGGCLADLNGDGLVDGADLGIMLSQWGS